jgi:hypothetical protein
MPTGIASSSMTADMPKNDARPAPNVLSACLMLTAIVVIAYPLVAVVAEQLMHKPVWETAGVAAGVCWFGSTLALVFFHLLRQAGNVAAATLLGMLFRIAIPLVAVVLVYSQGGKLVDEEFFKLVLVFYFVTLTADTLLTLRLAKAAATGVGKEGRRHG